MNHVEMYLQEVEKAHEIAEGIYEGLAGRSEDPNTRTAGLLIALTWILLGVDNIKQVERASLVELEMESGIAQEWVLQFMKHPQTFAGVFFSIFGRELIEHGVTAKLENASKIN